MLFQAVSMSQVIVVEIQLNLLQTRIIVRGIEMFGDDQQYSLEGHQFAVFGFCLTSDLRYIVSISNKFITWDLSTSDMTRDVNPGIEGIMQQLVLSPDNRFAAAYTNNNQVSYFAERCSHENKYFTNY
jgi:hypothetical protein